MVKKTNAQLVEENKQLAEQNKILMGKDTSSNLPKSLRKANSFMDEIQNIKKKARVDSNKIVVKEFTDHKNISLWTKYGKRVGPLHRSNALATLQRFWDIGIHLSADQPTTADVEEYKQTDEYKEWKKKEDARRELKAKSLKKGEMEKLIKQMAILTGQNVSAIQNLINSGPISLQEGQKLAGVK